MTKIRSNLQLQCVPLSGVRRNFSWGGVHSAA